jgi:hypothetical protein
LFCQVYFVYNGTYCYTSAALLNGYGNAFAEQQLVSGACNTSSLYASGWDNAVNTSEKYAGITWEPTFHQIYASYEAGNIFFAQFAEVESGGPTGLVGTWNNYSPLF